MELITELPWLIGLLLVVVSIAHFLSLYEHDMKIIMPLYAKITLALGIIILLLSFILNRL